MANETEDKSLGDTINDGMSNITNGLNNLSNGIDNLADKLNNSAYMRGANAIGNKASEAANAARNTMNSAKNKATNAVKNSLPGRAANSAINAVEKGKSAISGAANNARNALNNKKDKATNAMKNAFNNSKVGQNLGKAKGAVNGVKNGVQNKANDAKNKIKEGANKHINNAKDSLKNTKVGQKAQGAMNQAQAMKKKADDAKEKVQSAKNNIKNKASNSKVGTAVKAAKAAAGDVKAQIELLIKIIKKFGKFIAIPAMMPLMIFALVLGMVTSVLALFTNFIKALFGDDDFADEGDAEEWSEEDQFAKIATIFRNKAKSSYDDMVSEWEDQISDYSSGSENLWGLAMLNCGKGQYDDTTEFVGTGHISAIHDKANNWMYSLSEYLDPNNTFAKVEGIHTSDGTYMTGVEPIFDTEKSKQTFDDNSGNGQIKGLGKLVAGYYVSRREMPISESKSWIAKTFRSYYWDITQDTWWNDLKAWIGVDSYFHYEAQLSHETRQRTAIPYQTGLDTSGGKKTSFGEEYLWLNVDTKRTYTSYYNVTKSYVTDNTNNKYYCKDTSLTSSNNWTLTSNGSKDKTTTEANQTTIKNYYQNQTDGILLETVLYTDQDWADNGYIDSPVSVINTQVKSDLQVTGWSGHSLNSMGYTVAPWNNNGTTNITLTGGDDIQIVNVDTHDSACPSTYPLCYQVGTTNDTAYGNGTYDNDSDGYDYKDYYLNRSYTETTPYDATPRKVKYSTYNTACPSSDSAWKYTKTSHQWKETTASTKYYYNSYPGQAQSGTNNRKHATDADIRYIYISEGHDSASSGTYNDGINHGTTSGSASNSYQSGEYYYNFSSNKVINVKGSYYDTWTEVVQGTPTGSGTYTFSYTYGFRDGDKGYYYEYSSCSSADSSGKITLTFKRYNNNWYYNYIYTKHKVYRNYKTETHYQYYNRYRKMHEYKLKVRRNCGIQLNGTIDSRISNTDDKTYYTTVGTTSFDKSIRNVQYTYDYKYQWMDASSQPIDVNEFLKVLFEGGEWYSNQYEYRTAEAETMDGHVDAEWHDITEMFTLEYDANAKKSTKVPYESSKFSTDGSGDKYIRAVYGKDTYTYNSSTGEYDKSTSDVYGILDMVYYGSTQLYVYECGGMGSEYTCTARTSSDPDVKTDPYYSNEIEQGFNSQGVCGQPFIEDDDDLCSGGCGAAIARAKGGEDTYNKTDANKQEACVDLYCYTNSNNFEKTEADGTIVEVCDSIIPVTVGERIDLLLEELKSLDNFELYDNASGSPATDSYATFAGCSDVARLAEQIISKYEGTYTSISKDGNMSLGKIQWTNGLIKTELLQPLYDEHADDMKAIWQSHVSGSNDDPFFLSSYDYSDFGDSIFPKGGVSKDEYIAAVTEVLGKDYSKQYQDLQALKNVQGYIDTILAALPWANNHPDVVIFLADLHNNFGGAFLTQDTGKPYTTWANHIWTAAYAAKGDSITIEDVLAAVNASDKSVLNGCTYKDAWITRRVSVCNDIIALKASMGDDFPTDCSSSSGANALLDFAYSWLNTPYSWGGGTNGPSKCNGDYGTCGVDHTATLGFDCSHFVYYCLTQCGYSKYGGYKATSAMHSTDWAGQGCQVICTKSNFDVGLLQPGDVILYSGHTTLYWGDGQEIGANGSPPHKNCISIRDIPKAPDMVIRVPQD